MRIDVKSIVTKRKEKIKEIHFKQRLLIIQVGDNPASNTYIKGKIKDCEEVGFEADLIKFHDNVSAAKVKNFIQRNGERYDGIILQEPANIDETGLYSKKHILEVINDRQDVDGFKKSSYHKPCTPLGIMNLLQEIRETDDLSGMVIAVVGRGKLVGEPLIPMLVEKRGTVISCNSKTPDLAAMTKQADIVISAVGKKNLITRNMLKDGAIVIDAGIDFDENGKLTGDCDKNIYDDELIQITTVPGGVGLMTRVTLLENLSKA